MKFHWGNGIFVFFALFLTLCGIFIVFALRQNTDLVSEDYYKKGADYSDQIRLNTRSVPFTDSIAIVEKGDSLRFTISESIRTHSDSLQVFFFRPSDKDEDFEVSFSLKNPIIGIDQKILIPGRYKLRFYWRMEEEAYEITKSLFVK